MYLSEATVKTHVSTVLTKLGLRDRARQSCSHARQESSNQAQPTRRIFVDSR
jgi:DNA-binding NarL/FixJ family response regulator